MPLDPFPSPAPIARRVRAFVAPVARATATPTLFDPARQGAFDLAAPPSPWLDLGWLRGFTRTSASKSAPVLAGIPPAPLVQVRESLSAEVACEFLAWTKLTLALSTGAQHMNLLAPAASAALAADGATAAPAIAVQSGSTATTINLASSGTAGILSGSWVAVDADYTGQTGYLGSPFAAAYLRQPLADVDYLRRVTFNVALVATVASGTLTLATPLPGGPPSAGAKLQALTGFVDREGGLFTLEVSALFVLEGSQGERIFFHYPRLQPIPRTAEAATPLDPKNAAGPQRYGLPARFLALPVTDPLDGERILCYRSFLPAPSALI